MRVFDVIKKKRDGFALSKEEIRFFIEGYVKGDIPDYQASALLMAIYYKGMTDEETAELTFAIRDSGAKNDFSDIKGIRVDKHSTGGVGDKTSLTVAPICATLGLKVAKLSGRGLAHTGGTIDKLESIDGFNTALSHEEFVKVVNKVGCAIIGQTESISPADKKLYALRDVTATVDSTPLIASSIMGKKLCADDDCIVLDVKVGSGTFMKTVNDAEKLATLMVNIGKTAGKKIRAVITDMNIPLGYAIGNSLEVIEAIKTLKGDGAKDYLEVCLTLSAHILELAGKGDYKTCYAMAKSVIDDGRAYKTFVEMVKAQGGDAQVVENLSFKKATISYNVLAPKSGYIYSVNAEEYGTASQILGAGRSSLGDKIDYSAGIILNKKVGDYVDTGDVIATLYTNDKKSINSAKERLLNATEIALVKPDVASLVLKVIG